MRKYVLVVLSVLISTPLLAQNTNTLGFGLYGNGTLNIHSANFTQLPGVPCCSPGFDGGNGLGWGLGLLANIPVSTNFLISPRLGFQSLSGSLVTDEARTMNVFGEAVPGTIRHTIDAGLPTLAADILLGYKPTTNLTFLLGPSLFFPLSATFEQSEEIIEPTSASFDVNGTRTRLQASGDIPENTAMYFGVTAGLSYDIPLTNTRSWIIAPNVMFTYNLSNISKSVDWTVHPLRFGVNVVYSPASSSENNTGLAKEEKSGNITANIRAVGVEADGRELPSVTLTVEEFLGSQMKPILPYVFFDENSSTLPARYSRLSPTQIGTFNEQKLHTAGMLETYYEMLNIVGNRMREYPQATITITGCTSDEGAEQRNSTLAQERAEVIKNYLQQTWGIAPGRITVQTRKLPEVPSNVKDKDGIVENRRVELVSSEPRVLDPVFTTDTVRTVNPPGVRFFPTAESDAPLDAWRVVASQEGNSIREFNGKGQPPAQVDWNLQDDQAHVPKAPLTMKYQLLANDVNGGEGKSVEGEIGINQRTIRQKRTERVKDKEIDRYSLIGFDYGDDAIKGQNARMLDKVKQRISLASNVTITGHTDKIGDETLNKNLATARANSVARYLKANNPEVQGVGESQLLYNNELPEGRFYNRTVKLVVESPVNE